MADISTKPWSNFTASDYTPEQWKAACLIVRGDGSTKAQCSLPVREPDGTLNKNACIAAAAVLAGARGGVNASDEEKAKARSKLRSLYSQIGMDAPVSLMHFENTKLDNFFAQMNLRPVKDLFHFGVKGMKWGFRRSDAQLAKAAETRSSEAADAVRARETLTAIRSKGSLSAASDADLNHLVNRLNLEKRYDDINPSTFERGHRAIKSTLDVGRTMNEAIKFANSPAGHLLARSLNLTSSKGRHTTPVEQLLKTVKKSKKAKV